MHGERETPLIEEPGLVEIARLQDHAHKWQHRFLLPSCLVQHEDYDVQGGMTRDLFLLSPIFPLRRHGWLTRVEARRNSPPYQAWGTCILFLGSFGLGIALSWVPQRLKKVGGFLGAKSIFFTFFLFLVLFPSSRRVSTAHLALKGWTGNGICKRKSEGAWKRGSSSPTSSGVLEWLCVRCHFLSGTFLQKGACCECRCLRARNTWRLSNLR